MKRSFFALACLGMIMVLQGCETLPSAGPATMDIATETATATADFAIVPLDAQNVSLVGATLSSSVRDSLGATSNRPARPVIDIGDQLTVSVWEPSPDGLFSTPENKQTVIKVTVDQSRTIFIPYAGRIDVAGLGAEDLRTAIARKLEGRAIDPQVQVTLVGRDSQNLTVVGDVKAPGQFDVPASGLRLIESIALARGTTAPSFETEVVIVRGTTRASVRMDDVLQSSANNIWLRPRDTIQVRHRPRSFTAFGAVTSQNLQPFQTERVTLAEALAQSGGLKDNLADAGGVFLFRYEAPARLDRINAPRPQSSYARGIPTIYQLDFSQPKAFFVASAFMMRDKDIIYVANAPASEFQKFTSVILSPLLGTARSVEALGN